MDTKDYGAVACRPLTGYYFAGAVDLRIIETTVSGDRQAMQAGVSLIIDPELM